MSWRDSNQIENACTLVGLRGLLGEGWTNEQLLDHVEEHGGCADLGLLEQVAPVKVWKSGFTLEGGPDWAQITQGDESLYLTSDEKIGVCYNTGSNQHMETVSVNQLESFAGKEMTALVTLDEE